MKKIMFNDRYALTSAVLEGIKTQTRRIAIFSKACYGGIDEEEMITWDCGGNELDIKPKYKVGEIVAIAQSYRVISINEMMADESDFDLYENFRMFRTYDTKGWNNKMFVKAELMPHQIQITNIRLELLQDITDEDCIAEGINESPFDVGFWENYRRCSFSSPREAYATLIDKISGKGTWEENPYVFVYEFKLIK